MSIPFTKVQAIGNDFVLFHAEDILHLDWPTLAIEACERHFGIGADGMLVVDLLSPSFGQLRMFNADGSEDFCGNGLRCAVHHAVTRLGANPELQFEQLGQLVPCHYQPSGTMIELPAARFDPASVPLSTDNELWAEPVEVAGATYTLHSLSTGSTHTIIFREDAVGDAEFFEVSPLLETNSLFPSRTSIMWTHCTGQDELQIRIWERGVGETQGCGTGATAAAIAWMRQRDQGGSIRVTSPGGSLVVKAEAWVGPIQLIGTASEVFSGELNLRTAPRLMVL